MLLLTQLHHIGIGTLKTNKKQALADACTQLNIPFQNITGHKVATGVSDMPSTRAETLQWAINRGKNCLKQNTTLDLACGAEWGIRFTDNKQQAYLFNAIALIDKTGYTSTVFSSEIQLPPSLVAPLLAGQELWPLMDQLQNTTNSNHKHGAVGYFTHNHVLRSQRFAQTLIMAFVPRLNHDQYNK